MKICLLPDLHLFSTEIGGNWAKDSFIIFKERILPRIKAEDPEIIIFLGDILDPHSGRSDPRWPRGAEASEMFVHALKDAGITNAYSLRGNHDYPEALRNISDMGGPKLIEDEWLRIGGVAFYFFSSRYPNIKKAAEELKQIPDISAESKILLLHENLSIKGAENVPREIIKELSERFDIIFNGHQHVYEQLFDNVWCLPSALPWRPGYEVSDLEISWEEGKELEIKENESKFGFWILESNKKEPAFISVDIGLKFVSAKLSFFASPAIQVRERLAKLSEILSERIVPEKTIIRVYLEGTLKSGDERIDVGFADLEEKYFAKFYEGRSRNILRTEKLRGGGAYLSKDDLRFITIEEALKQLEPEIPDIRDFYEEVYDLIEKKTFDGDTLIDRIMKSKVLGERDAL